MNVAPRRLRPSTVGLALLAVAVLALAALALRHGRPGTDTLSTRAVDQPTATEPPALPRSAPEPSLTPTPQPTPSDTPEAVSTHGVSSHPAETFGTVERSAEPSPSLTPAPRVTATPTPRATSNPSPTPTEHTTTIVISGYAFSPGTLRIRVGETVTVINQDVDDHDLTSEEWTTGNLSQGQSQQHTFNTPGQYDYLCSIHTSMTGTIIVS